VQRDELVRFPEFLERGKARRQPECVGELDELRRIERKLAAQRSIRRIAVRHHGGQPVEAAAQQHEHEPPRRGHLREIDDRKSERGDAAGAHVAEERTAMHGHLH